MVKLIFVWMLLTGAVKPNQKDLERPTYRLETKEYSIEYAYKEEIEHYIKTKKFVYDETFEND